MGSRREGNGEGGPSTAELDGHDIFSTFRKDAHQMGAQQYGGFGPYGRTEHEIRLQIWFVRALVPLVAGQRDRATFLRLASAILVSELFIAPGMRVGQDAKFARFSRAMLTVYEELLSAKPSIIGYEERKRMLQHIYSLILDFAGSERVSLRLARECLEQGKLSEAYDALTCRLFDVVGGKAKSITKGLEDLTPEAFFEGSCICGLTRQRLWEQRMQLSWEQSGNTKSGAWDPFRTWKGLAAQTGTQGKDYARDAGLHWREARQIRPEHSAPVWPQLKLYIGHGDFQALRGLIESMSGSSNADIAAARFLAVFSLEQQPQQSDEEEASFSHDSIATSSAAGSLTTSGDKRTLSPIAHGAKRRRTTSKSEVPSEIVTYNLLPDLLTILCADPSCSEAAHALVALLHRGVPHSVESVEALMLWLDVARPNSKNRRFCKLKQRVWDALGEGIVSLADKLIEQTERGLDVGPNEAWVNAQRTWQRCVRLLRQRQWWQDRQLMAPDSPVAPARMRSVAALEAKRRRHGRVLVLYALRAVSLERSDETALEGNELTTDDEELQAETAKIDAAIRAETFLTQNLCKRWIEGTASLKGAEPVHSNAPVASEQ